MKKEILCGLFGLMVCSGMQAQMRTVDLQSSDVEDYPTLGPEYKVPTVRYDEANVFVSADTLIYNVTVIVRDCNGNMIYCGKTTVSPADSHINLPRRYQGQKYKVELYYDDKYLYGYFNK